MSNYELSTLIMFNLLFNISNNYNISNRQIHYYIKYSNKI